VKFKQEWVPPAKGYAHLAAQINKLAEALKATAKQWEVPVLDFHHLFLNNQGMVKTSLFLRSGDTLLNY